MNNQTSFFGKFTLYSIKIDCNLRNQFRSINLCNLIPIVLYGIVRTTIQELLKLWPLVFMLDLEYYEDTVLCQCPRGLLDVWVELVVPSFSALFAIPLHQMWGYGVPLKTSKPNDLTNQNQILFFAPNILCLWLFLLHFRSLVIWCLIHHFESWYGWVVWLHSICLQY